MKNAEILGRIFAICSRSSFNNCDQMNFFTNPRATFGRVMTKAYARGDLSGYADIRITDLVNELPPDLGVATPMTNDERSQFALGFLKEQSANLIEKAESTVTDIVKATEKSRTYVYDMARKLGRLPTVDEVSSDK